MLGTSTHDTKRGEDVRMRLVALAEIPEEWSERVRVWHRILGAEARALDDASLEYFFYQTLLGSYPAATFSVDEYRGRLCDAMTKAAREARSRTSWARPNEDYERRLTALIDAALASPAFMDDFRPFQRRVARAGAQNSLVQTVLKLTLPGVPDIYQGAELWDLSLVDPDNRRPVDYSLRSELLTELLDRWEQDPVATISSAAAEWQDGRIKLLLTALLLRLRAGNEALVTGEYRACEVTGDPSRGAYLRQTQGSAVLVTFRRFPFAGSGAISRIQLPGTYGVWRDALRPGREITGEELARDTELPVGVYLSKPL
jgi:(1->4)-alpha-D-glucan 1-alpha-D-glucosylmutase